MTPELKSPSVDMPFNGFTQEAYAQKLIDEYKAANVPAPDVFAQSFNLNDVLYWIANEPAFGGIARFATLVQQLRAEANGSAVLLSSGDNYLAGPEFSASLDKGVPFFDSIALDLIGYDAFAIGNHEFDFGPDVFADFLNGFTSANPAPFLSANLDLSGEANLRALADAGRIASRTVVTVNGEQVGIVGATTPSLPFISSPRNVVVSPDVAALVQAEIDQLTAQGINKMILISHLQGINADLELAPQLRDIDIMIAGGGGELLANPETLLIPGDEINPDRPYPITTTGADGNQILVMTTPGDYRYLGRLIVTFDAAGLITSFDPASGPVRISGGANPDAVQPDPAIQTQVVEPVQAFIDTLNTSIGSSEVALDGRRSEVRTRETNQGHLIADALLFEAVRNAEAFGVPVPTVALQNGGGIRNDSILPAGPLTLLDTFSMLPFANFVTVVPNISAAQFKDILENAVSGVENTSGRFAQVAGFTFVYSPSGEPRQLSDTGDEAGDAFGFGFFPGQFAMVVYAKFPIDEASVRTFQNFVWNDMPGALLPDDPATPAPADYYSPEELAVFRLSSKSHWDVPIQIDGQVVHFLTSHPTPPVFDGPEAQPTNAITAMPTSIHFACFIVISLPLTVCSFMVDPSLAISHCPHGW